MVSQILVSGECPIYWQYSCQVSQAAQRQICISAQTKHASPTIDQSYFNSIRDKSTLSLSLVSEDKDRIGCDTLNSNRINKW